MSGLNKAFPHFNIVQLQALAPRGLKPRRPEGKKQPSVLLVLSLSGLGKRLPHFDIDFYFVLFYDSQ
ncbi:hypothetical protein B9K06_01585 [Bacillus sp. OG2]|nr:hypothetical protein B9K06_01585 [Bacillus sp. OG2]